MCYLISMSCALVHHHRVRSAAPGGKLLLGTDQAESASGQG
jgi:hypothetical protein